MKYHFPIPDLYSQMAREHQWTIEKYTEFVEARLRKAHPRMKLTGYKRQTAICERREKA